MRRRFWLEAVTAALSAVLAVLTVFWPDWIEVTGWEPDSGSGGAEWVVAAGLGFASVLLSFLARLEWRRPLG